MDLAIEPLSLPKIPDDWDYDEAVKRIKIQVYKWKSLTKEMANDLLIARAALSKKGRPTGSKTWAKFCQDIGSQKRIVNRWLQNWFTPMVHLTGTIVPPILPAGIYDIILCDPPWRNPGSWIASRAVERHYATLSTPEIIDYHDADGILITNKFADDSILFLWATSPMLPDALKVMEAWRFEYQTNAVWTKAFFGCGWLFRNQHEQLLLGKQGDVSVPNPADRPSSVISAPRREHSRKPNLYAMIEKMYPDRSYLELFARNKKGRSSWTFFGDEALKEKANGSKRKER